MRRSGYEFDKIDISEGKEYPEESSYWYAMPCERTVLAVVRSVNTTLALIDGLPDLLHDRRVEVLFTIMPKQRDANFESWMRRLIQEAGARETSWEDALQRQFDLVVAASYEGSLSDLSGPLMILSHGTGFAKYLALPSDGRLPVSTDGRSPTTMVLSHAEQRRYFAPEQSERMKFLVAGDPWRDRLCASRHRRDRYRSTLGIGKDARLIVVSSTWGEYSLIATHPDLPVKLLSELPWDEYRVALTLHPNVWFGHSTWQIRTWLREAVGAGLLLVPPGGAWRGVLVAADGYVGDHGSMMLLAGALEKPLAFGCPPNDELIDDGPSAELEGRVLRLDPGSSPAPQIDRMFADHNPAADAATLQRVFEHPGESHAILRREMYELMRLDEPEWPPRVLAVDVPEVTTETLTAYRVQAQHNGDGSTSISRFPVVQAITPPPPPPPPPPPNFHLVVEDDDRDGRLLQSAAIVLRRDPKPPDDWGHGALRENPGAMLCAAVSDSTGAIVTTREGEMFTLTPTQPPLPFDSAVLASALHAHRMTGQPGDPLPELLTVRVGERSAEIRLDRHRIGS